MPLPQADGFWRRGAIGADDTAAEPARTRAGLAVESGDAAAHCDARGDEGRREAGAAQPFPFPARDRPDHVRAGGSLLESFRAAADACGNAALAAATYQAVEKIQRGSGLAEAFGGEPGSIVPEVLLRALEIGEQAGCLDEESSRAALALNQRVVRLIAVIGTWLPRLLYFIVVLVTLWQIYQMVTTMSGTVSSLLAPQ